MKVGVLGIQGAVEEHLQAIASLGVETVKLVNVEDFSGIDGIILPGGVRNNKKLTFDQ